MLIYNLTLKYSSKKARKDEKDTLNPTVDDRKFKEIIADANDRLGPECGLEGNLSAQVVAGRTGTLEIIIVFNQEKLSVEECESWIQNHFMENYSITKATVVESKEISVKEFIRSIKSADKMGFCNRGYLYNDLDFDYFNNYRFTVQEYLYDTKPLSKDEAIDEAKMMMADQSFIDELNRIYDSNNERKFYGHPVHYMIASGNVEAAKDMMKLLVRALKSNGRLLGTRATYLCNIEEECHHDDDLEHLIKLSKGATVAIEMTGSDEDHGVYASSYHQVIQYFEEQINRCQLNTLFVFVELTEKPGFSKPMIATMQEDLHIIEIKEGHGDRERAIEFLETLTRNSMFEATTEELEESLPKKKEFSASEVYEIYNKWFSNGLKNKVYQSYQNCKKVSVDFKKPSDHPYEELQKMIGLTEIKGIVDQIINANKVQKARSLMGLDSYGASRHMIFTGNPGSAKTTVARLLAQILKKEEILESGNLVECGRADLIAKYVGWTAKTVRKKFREAQGGILFIDEAYSLVDDSNSFGDEAINTIVQEMENHREDVIVIFAGYPEKMESFLQKNEGLRSRIAFHLNFPDYTENELLEILMLMAKEKGYSSLDDATKEKCLDIFSSACKNEEFGNGRFARNLLEQAMLRQSDRIIRESKGKQLSKRKLNTLIATDFEVNATKQYAKPAKRIGF